MSGGTRCTCPESKKPLALRVNWVVYDRQCNRSAFSGYRYTPSDWSAVGCLACQRSWRTKAAYVQKLRDGHRGGKAT